MKYYMVWVLMWFSLAAHSAVFTVSFSANPNADYSDLQTAINAAINAGGTNEVRMQSGNGFNTNLSISISNGSNITLSGGWDSDFNTQADSFTSTSLYAGVDLTSYGSSRVMNIGLTDGSLNLQNFAIQRGSNVGFGAGINALINGPSEFSLTHVLLANNYAITTGSSTGAGMSVAGFGTSQVHIIDTAITNNIAESSGSTVSGVGLLAMMNAQSQLTVTNSTFTRNRSIAVTQATGVGVLLTASQDAEVEFTHNFLAQNIITEASSASGVNASISFIDRSIGVIANNDVQLAQNDDPDVSNSTLVQINLVGADDSNVWFANNFVHNALTNGIRSQSRDNALVTLINNTFYDHGESSVSINGGSNARFANNIMALDDTFNVIQSGVLQSNNSTANPLLIDADEPMIPASSPARDMGNNNPWPDALPAFDFYDNNRIGNTGIVDIGAAEVQVADEFPIFANGFEGDDDQ